jgi:CRISPR-associated protein Csm2
MNKSHYRDRQTSSGSSRLSNEDYQRIIVEGDARTLTDLAETIGTSLARQLTTAQIRNVFGTVRQIEMSWGPRASESERKHAARQLLLLKPKLAYQARRQRGKGVQDLADVLIPAIDLVGEDREQFQNFVDFFEAILAYHTAAGGQ